MPKKLICKFFLNGDCRKGNRCDFSHKNIKKPSLNSDGSAKVCHQERYYGKCLRETCNFPHVGTNLKKVRNVYDLLGKYLSKEDEKQKLIEMQHRVTQLEKIEKETEYKIIQLQERKRQIEHVKENKQGEKDGQHDMENYRYKIQEKRIYEEVGKRKGYSGGEEKYRNEGRICNKERFDDGKKRRRIEDDERTNRDEFIKKLTDEFFKKIEKEMKL